MCPTNVRGHTTWKTCDDQVDAIDAAGIKLF